MRKFLASALALVAVLSVGLTVFAEDYTYSPIYFGKEDVVENIESTDVDPSMFSTVLVVRIADENGNDTLQNDPVYVDQEDEGFGSGARFLLMNKSGLATGTYKMTFGDADGVSDRLYFYVGDFKFSDKDKMAVADPAEKQDGKYINGAQCYRKGFVVEDITFDTYASYKSIKLVAADGSEVYGAVSLDGGIGNWENKGTTFSGEGQMSIGIQIYDIPENYKDLNLYFSTDDVVAVEGGSN